MAKIGIDAPWWDKPLAVAPLLSYRYRVPAGPSGGYVMIGATDDADALRQAARSCAPAHVPVFDNLEAWNTVQLKYLPA